MTGWQLAEELLAKCATRLDRLIDFELNREPVPAPKLKDDGKPVVIAPAIRPEVTPTASGASIPTS